MGFFIALSAPYSSTISPEVQTLEARNVTASIVQTVDLENPFRSVHAVALANLVELVSGLSVMSEFHRQARAKVKVRGIVTSMRVEYGKKARGIITCSNEEFPPIEKGGEVEVVCVCRDEGGDVVCTGVVEWSCKVGGGK